MYTALVTNFRPNLALLMAIVAILSVSSPLQRGAPAQQHAEFALTELLEPSSLRKSIWDTYWLQNVGGADAEWWDNSNVDTVSAFVGFISKVLPAGGNRRVLQLSAGDSRLIAHIHEAGLMTDERIQHLANADISPMLIDSLKARYPQASYPKTSFLTLDSLQMQLDNTLRFDVVIEKGGVSDIYAAKPGEKLYLQQFLRCVVHRAFGGKGGILITMGFMPPPGYDGLPGALKKHSELNCYMRRIEPVGIKYAKHGGRLVIFLIQCLPTPRPSFFERFRSTSVAESC